MYWCDAKTFCLVGSSFLNKAQSPCQFSFFSPTFYNFFAQSPSTKTFSDLSLLFSKAFNSVFVKTALSGHTRISSTYPLTTLCNYQGEQLAWVCLGTRTAKSFREQNLQPDALSGQHVETISQSVLKKEWWAQFPQFCYREVSNHRAWVRGGVWPRTPISKTPAPHPEMSTTSSRKWIFHTSFFSADPVSSIYTNEPCYWPALNCHLSLACHVFNNNKNKYFCSTYSVLGSTLGTLRILTSSSLFIYLAVPGL